MISRHLVVAEARARLGMRWQHQARLDGVACDCLGLVVLVAVAVGVPGAVDALNDQDLQEYGREPDYARALAASRRYMAEIPVVDAQIGDVLYMRVPRGRSPQHFGIKSLDDPPYMVHAWARSRGVVENRIDDAWQSRISHAFRFRDVA